MSPQAHKLNPVANMQDWDPRQYADHARFVSDYGRSLVEILAPQPHERILDLGCGDGVLTCEIAERGCRVVGVDASPSQVEAAQRRGVTAVVCNGHQLPFEHQFDAAFSNAALHWMKRPDDVLHGVFRALKPGGRFVAEFGGAGNVQAICTALRFALHQHGHDFDRLNPWYFPSTDEYRQKLIAAGFRVVQISSFERPTPLPGDLIGWLETFAQSFTLGWPSEQRLQLFHEVREALLPKLHRSGEGWIADYVRLRFVAAKP